jgi:hypothetical protein
MVSEAAKSPGSERRRRRVREERKKRRAGWARFSSGKRDCWTRASRKLEPDKKDGGRKEGSPAHKMSELAFSYPQ